MAGRGEQTLQSLAERIIQLDGIVENENISNRFNEVDDTAGFVEGMKNQNTKRKTTCDLNLFRKYLASVGERRDPIDIDPPELNMLLARFFLNVRKSDGVSEYEPDTLKTYQSSIARYLSEKNYSVNILTDVSFKHSRDVLSAKRKELKAKGKGNKERKAEPLTREELAILYEKGQLGIVTTMALSAAEKQRRYRSRRDQDPEKRAEYLLKRRSKYKKDIKDGKRHLVISMSKRQHRAATKKWRMDKKDLRERNKQAACSSVWQSPPSTPGAVPEEAIQSPPSRHSGLSRQKVQSMKKAKLEKAKYQKERDQIQSQLKQEERKTEMYRKRWQRELNRNKNENSPRTKTRKLLRYSSAKTVRKALNFHHVLLSTLRKGKGSVRKSLKSILSGQILKKYKMKTVASKHLGVTPKRKMPKTKMIAYKRRKSVQDFFERDDVSRLLNGQKKTVTKQKVKKQKRLLLDSLTNLHLKYKSETRTSISYATFCRLRPFWVVQATEKDRETCLCKICENYQYVTEALTSHKVLALTSTDGLVGQTVCSTKNKACMYSECKNCTDRIILLKITDQNEPVSWLQWKSVKEERVLKSGQKKTVTITIKNEEHGTMADLADKLYELTGLFKKHLYNIRNQFKHYRDLGMQLKSNECFIHIDFSENFVGKMYKEIQSMHFGASQPQITLHTGFYEVGGSSKVCFSGVSDSLEHGPAAIWAHLDPVLDDIKQQHPEVTHLHFYSDGPCTQYRQKCNFFMLSTETYRKGFLGATWNFHESGHGKGIPDGVGGILKNTANTTVRHGTDIMNAKSFVDVLSKACPSIKLYLVKASDIAIKEKKLKKTQLKTVPGTMRIHHVETSCPLTIKYSDVSCLCLQDSCSHLKFQNFTFAQRRATTVQQEGHSPDETKANRSNIKGANQTYQKVQQKKTIASANGKNDARVSGRHEHVNLFTSCLSNRFQQCKTFNELREICKSVNFEDIVGKSRFIVNEGFSVDEASMDLCPSDIPLSEDDVRFPVNVVADGDCLPGTGSVFAYGNDKHTTEMRLRIVNELVTNKSYYLDDTKLNEGLDIPTKSGETKKSFAFYSDEYTYGDVLTNNIIEKIFEQECLKITKPKSYMGIWQVCALSNVLQMPIFSAYPHRGSERLRRDLHRKILPRNVVSTDMAVILWTSTRSDMKPEHWNPNHFVPVLGIDTNRVALLKTDAGARSENMKEQMKECEKNESEQVTGEDVLEVIKETDVKEQMKEFEKNESEQVTGEDVLEVITETDVKEHMKECEKNESEQVTGEDVLEVINGVFEETDVKEGMKKCEKKNEYMKTSKETQESMKCENVMSEEIHDINEYLEKHVVVLYDGLLYPGKVTEVGLSDVYVECMHRVGRKKVNCFFWPRKIKDICWYSIENVLCIIPPPKQIGNSNHFMVDNDIWQSLENKNNKS